jgi:hypothetical protein
MIAASARRVHISSDASSSGKSCLGGIAEKPIRNERGGPAPPAAVGDFPEHAARPSARRTAASQAADDRWLRTSMFSARAAAAFTAIRRTARAESPLFHGPECGLDRVEHPVDPARGTTSEWGSAVSSHLYNTLTGGTFV